MTYSDTEIWKMYKKVKNENVIRFMKNQRRIKARMNKIIRGKIQSKRFQLVVTEKTQDFGLYSRILKLANITFLEEDDVTDNVILKIAKEATKKQPIKLPKEVCKGNYVKYVVIPEVIIMYLQRKFKLTYEEADDMFFRCSDVHEN